MPHDFYPDIVKLLLEAGWARSHGGKGSHERWRSPAGDKTVLVARTKSRHTANEVLKQAGLPKAF